MAGWRGASRVEDGKQSITPARVSGQDDVLDVADRGRGGTEGGPPDR